MKKRVSIILASIFILALLLTGCGGMGSVLGNVIYDVSASKLLNEAKTNAEYQNTRLIVGMDNDNAELMKEALASGATPEDVELPNYEKYMKEMDDMGIPIPEYDPKTAIGIALNCRDKYSLLLMIDNGANKDYVDDNGMSYLSICAEKNMDRGKCLPLLLDKGIDPNIVSNEGYTALDYFIKAGIKIKDAGIIDAFLEHGAKVTEKTIRLAYQNYQKMDLTNFRTLVMRVKENGAETGLSKIVEAAVLGDAETFKNEILKWGIPEGDRDLILNCIVALGNPDMLDSIASKENTPKNKAFPYILLMIAAKYGNLENVQYLVQNGYDVNVKYEKSYSESDPILAYTPLMWAVKNNRYEIAKYLLDMGAVILGNDLDDYNELSLAAENGNIEMAKLLLESGIPLDEDCVTTAIKCAMNAGQTNILPFLAGIHNSGTDIPENRYYMYDALCSENAGAVQFAIQNGDKCILLDYVPIDNIEVIKLLLKNGADPNYKDKYGVPNNVLYRAVKKGKLDLIKVMVESGADLQTRYDGETILQWAAENGSQNVLAYLIESGSIVNETYTGDSCYEYGNAIIVPGDTALHLAVRNGWRECTELLIKSGADTTMQNSKGDTPYDLAVFNKNDTIKKIFEENGVINEGNNNQSVKQAGQTIKEWIQKIITKAVIEKVSA